MDRTRAIHSWDMVPCTTDAVKGVRNKTPVRDRVGVMNRRLFAKGTIKQLSSF